MMELITEVKEMRKEQKIINENFKELKLENNKLKEENLEMRKKITKLEVRTEEFERREKKNNIIVKGLEVKSNNNEVLKEEMERFIKERLEVTIKIKECYKIRDKTLIIKLKSFKDKMEIMKTKNKLRNYKAANIYINNDRTRREREIDKIIKERTIEERTKGNTVRTGYNKLIINGIVWTWNEQRELLEKREDIRTQQISKN